MRVEHSQQSPTSSSSSLKLADFIATGFYSGRIAGPSGTWGTLAAFLFVFLLLQLFPLLASPDAMALLALGTTILGILTAEYVLRGRLYGENKDPRAIVIDEFAGFFVSIIGAGGQLHALVLSFVLFRLFDITKPYPIRKLEKLHGGFGVVLDDIVAGFYALFFVHLLETLLF